MSVENINGAIKAAVEKLIVQNGKDILPQYEEITAKDIDTSFVTDQDIKKHQKVSNLKEYIAMKIFSEKITTGIFTKKTQKINTLIGNLITDSAKIAYNLKEKFLYDVLLVLTIEYSKELQTELTKPVAKGGAKKVKKVKKGGFANLDYDTQKMYNAQGLVTDLSQMNAPNMNVSTNQPNPFSASGPSGSATFESLPIEMIAGLTPSYLGGAGKKKK